MALPVAAFAAGRSCRADRRPAARQRAGLSAARHHRVEPRGLCVADAAPADRARAGPAAALDRRTAARGSAGTAADEQRQRLHALPATGLTLQPAPARRARGPRAASVGGTVRDRCAARPVPARRGIRVPHRLGKHLPAGAHRSTRLLAIVLGPAAKLLGMPFPSVDAIEAMRITGGSGGDRCGTVDPSVRGDRRPGRDRASTGAGCLGRVARARARSRASARSRRRLLPPRAGGFAPSSARVRVVPYSYTLDEARSRPVSNALARHLLGDATQLALRPSIGLRRRGRRGARSSRGARTTSR